METVRMLFYSKLTDQNVLTYENDNLDLGETKVSTTEFHPWEIMWLKDILKYRKCIQTINPKFKFLVEDQNIFDVGVETTNACSDKNKNTVDVILRDGSKQSFNFDEFSDFWKFKELAYELYEFHSAKKEFDGFYDIIQFCKIHQVKPQRLVLSKYHHVIEAKSGDQECKIDIFVVENSQGCLDYVLSYLL